MRKKIIFTGGGTAGHVMPNIALMPHFVDYEIHYIGCPNSIEEELVKKHCPDVSFHAVKCTKLNRGSFIKNLCVPFRLLSSTKKAKRLLKEIKPDVIFSKGGFVALPVTLAAKKIPVILHESDFSFGLANRLALKKCNTVCASFKPLANSTDKGVHTGAPLRSSLYKGDKTKVKLDGFNVAKKNLLIFGGSLGALAINEAVNTNIDELLKRFNVIHITGKSNKYPLEKTGYQQLEFVSNIENYFAWADFSVTRGGANALFELVALRIPSLVIPLPKGVSRGDQIDNAAYFEKLGCVQVLPQHLLLDNNSNPSNFIAALDNMVKNGNRIKSACQNAGQIDGTLDIVNKIKNVVSD